MSNFRPGQRGWSEERDYKKIKGGISKEAWEGISKKDRKEMAKAGLTQSRWVEGHFGETGNERSSSKGKMWEQAAWEMGFGNVKNSKDLKKLYKRGQDLDFNNFNSMNDVKKFDKTSKKSIEAQIEEAVKKKMKHIDRGKSSGNSDSEANEDRGTNPQVVAGAGDWQSQYMEVINKFLEQMGNQQQQQNPYLPQQQAQPWTPRGGW